MNLKNSIAVIIGIIFLCLSFYCYSLKKDIEKLEFELKTSEENLKESIERETSLREDISNLNISIEEIKTNYIKNDEARKKLERNNKKLNDLLKAASTTDLESAIKEKRVIDEKTSKEIKDLIKHIIID